MNGADQVWGHTIDSDSIDSYIVCINLAEQIWKIALYHTGGHHFDVVHILKGVLAFSLVALALFALLTAFAGFESSMVGEIVSAIIGAILGGILAAKE